MKHYLHTPIARQLLSVLLSTSLMTSLPTLAANVALSSSPLVTSSALTVAPNLMLMLDDSGSMDWDYMPDNAKNFAGKYGYNSNQCNGVYYDPNQTYNPPIKADGTSYPAATYPIAQNDGYDNASGNTNLNTGFKGGSGTGASGISLTPGPAFYYKYTGLYTTSSQKDYFNTASPFYVECNSGTTPAGLGGGTSPFTKVLVSSLTAAQQTNFANWFSYYSTRMLTMKTGVGAAFSSMNSRFRIGYMSMNNNNGTDIVDIAPFSSAQKSAWYTKLYSASPGQSTPLRQALSQVGSLYANKYAAVPQYVATITINSIGTVSSITVPGGGYELMAAPSVTDTTTKKVATQIAGQINANTTSPFDAVATNNVIKITGPSTANLVLPTIVPGGGLTYSQTAFALVPGVATTLNGITPKDPMEYSCQKNFVILSTDGYWNGNAGYKVDGTAVGNQDGLAPRSPLPMYDGTIVNKSTAQIRQTETRVALSTSQLMQWQKKDSNLQQTTSVLQSSAWQLQNVPTYLQSQTSQLKIQTSTLTGTVSRVLLKCNNNTATCGTAPVTGVPNALWVLATSCTSGTGSGGTASPRCARVTPSPALTRNVTTSCNIAGSITSASPYTATNTDNGYLYSNCSYTAWSTATNTGSCTAVNQSATPTNTTALTATQCPTTITSAWANTALTCTTTVPNASGVSTACRYNTPTTIPANVGSCTYQTRSASSPYTVITENICSYATAPVVTTTATCTTSAKTIATTNGTPYNASAITCGYSSPAVVANVSTCTPATKSTASPYTVAAEVSCAYTAWPASWTNVTSCTTAPQDTTTYNMAATAGIATQCQQIPVSACAGGTTCTIATTGSSTNYVAACTPGTSGTITTTCYPTTLSTNVPVAACGGAASSANGYVTSTCTTATTGPTTVSSCIAQSATLANSYTSTTCSGGTGGTADTLADTSMYYYETDLRDASLSNCTGVSPPGVDVCENNVRTSGIDTNKQQHLTTFTLGLGARGKMAFSSNYLADTSGDFYDITNGTTASPPTICAWQTGGACNWPVPVSGTPTTIDDLWHAAINGRGTYFNATDAKSLSVGLSSALKSIDQATGAAAAAATSSLNPRYQNNSAYVASYTTVKWTGNLEQRDINTSTGNIVQNAGWCVEDVSQSTCKSPKTIVTELVGNSTIYYCSTPAVDVVAPSGIDELDCTAPEVLTTVGATQVCRAEIQYACQGTMPSLVTDTADTRKIYTTNGSTRVPFNSANVSAGTYFSATTLAGLTQWPALTATQKTAASTNMVNFLRGQNAFEENRTSYVDGLGNTIHATTDWLYRYRDATMGDALESEPSFIGKPNFSYIDAGYSAFITAQTNRPELVFIGTNDGMLHAFHAKDQVAPPTGTKCVVGGGTYCGGEEAWAYVPKIVIPNMWRLADTNYGAKHFNFINGSATISDICDGTPTQCADPATAVWKTILVGGLNGGGRGYYALDVTDPTDPAYPKVLWEFTPTQSANLGYSYGRPIITKKQDGTWVVLITSGYDNGDLGPDGTAYAIGGDGKGYLYTLKASDGSIISSLSTGEGDPATPSGLAKFEAYADATYSNQAGYVYAGDLLGNLWRFDINKAGSTSTTAPNPFKLAKLYSDAAGSLPQPITTEPTLSKVNGQRVVFVGTGQYLASTDLSNTQLQSLYGIKDDQNTISPTLLDNPRSSANKKTTAGQMGKMVQQTMTGSNGVRTNNNPSAVDFSTDRGWFVDFPDAGERVNIVSTLVQGVLVVPTIVPSNSICSPGGYGWLNFFDYKTGGSIYTVDKVVGVKTDSTIVGVNILYINQVPIVEIVSSSNPTPVIPQYNGPVTGTLPGQSPGMSPSKAAIDPKSSIDPPGSYGTNNGSGSNIGNAQGNGSANGSGTRQIWREL
jgi:Tfp pilus tip-associated adhesin PilY1